MSVRVELLIIGNEILSGRVQDINSQWLAQQLLQLSLPVRRVAVVEDNINAIADALHSSCNRGTQVIITSGGLGPTFDDRTAEALAFAAHVDLEVNEKALAMIATRTELLHAQGFLTSSELTPPRRKMARLPRGAEPLRNSTGTAPGIAFKLDSSQVFCLPGVPRELRAIFTEEVQPRLVQLARQAVLEEMIEVPLLDESALGPLIDTIMKTKKGVYLKSMPYFHESRYSLRVIVTVTADTEAKARQLLRRVIRQLEHDTKSRRQVL
jgi:nicotinamide-nucleotide amidase